MPLGGNVEQHIISTQSQVQVCTEAYIAPKMRLVGDGCANSGIATTRKHAVLPVWHSHQRMRAAQHITTAIPLPPQLASTRLHAVAPAAASEPVSKPSAPALAAWSAQLSHEEAQQLLEVAKLAAASGAEVRPLRPGMHAGCLIQELLRLGNT